MESDDAKRTRQEVRINSTTIVIVTIIGFVVSVGLYIFFVIIPLRRTEQKADAVLKSVQDTSNQVSKLVTNLENIVHDYEELKDAIESRFQTEKTVLCEEGPIAFCTLFDDSTELKFLECVTSAEKALAPLCKATTQPEITTGIDTTTSSDVTFSSNPGKYASSSYSSSNTSTNLSSRSGRGYNSSSGYSAASGSPSDRTYSSSSPFASKGYSAPSSKKALGGKPSGADNVAKPKYRAPDTRS